MKLILLAAIFCCVSIKLTSQNQIEVTAALKEENYFRLKYDNDLFARTDRYYTQGITLDFIHPVIKRSPLSFILIKLKKSDFNYFGCHLQQDVFTPKSIRYKGGQIYYGERPFTAILLFAHSLNSINSHKNMLVATQLDVGLMGPLALGKEEQNAIHKALENNEPLGWENQLSNAPVLNYKLSIEKGLIIKKYLVVMAQANSRVGTLYNDLGLGFKIQAGHFDCWFKPASAKGLNFYFYGSAKSKLVGYNATLQGGLTPRGNVYVLPAASIKRQVIEAAAGIALIYKRLGLQYARYYASKEFTGGANHSWGSCCLTIRF